MPGWPPDIVQRAHGGGSDPAAVSGVGNRDEDSSRAALHRRQPDILGRSGARRIQGQLRCGKTGKVRRDVIYRVAAVGIVVNDLAAIWYRIAVAYFRYESWLHCGAAVFSGYCPHDFSPFEEDSVI
jgi:hypothetical protein